MAVAVVVLIVLTALTLALGGFLGWLLVGRERARERAAFLAEAGTLLDRGTTSAEVLETFAALALERGNGYCAAEELAAGPSMPELELGRVSSGDATVVPPGDRPRSTPRGSRLGCSRGPGARPRPTARRSSPSGQVHVLALAAMARGGLIARVVLARRGRGWRREEVRRSGLGTRLALTLQARRSRRGPRRSTARAITSRARSSRASCPTDDPGHTVVRARDPVRARRRGRPRRR